MDSIDTRLLSVFDEIYRRRSVSEAAEALYLGQPAVSVALAKLRNHFADPLFVRTTGGMEPTPFAQGLAPQIRNAVDAVNAVLGHRNDFHPETSTRSFRVCMADISQLVLLPVLWERLHVIAPGVCIEVLPLTAETGELLSAGKVDFALGVMPQLVTGIYQKVLFQQNFVCLVGRHHPRIGEQLTMADYESESHAVVSWSGQASAIVDREIARLGIKRRVALQIPNFLGAAFVAEYTDLVLTVPKRLGDVLSERAAIRILPVPFAVPAYDVKLHWHERLHNDEGHRWLRRLISDLLSA